MATISKNEYMNRLRSYVVEQMMLLSEEEKPRGLRENVDFNKEKAREFGLILEAEGTTVE